MSKRLQLNRWSSSLPLSFKLCWVSQLELYGILNYSLFTLFLCRQGHYLGRLLNGVMKPTVILHSEGLVPEPNKTMSSDSCFRGAGWHGWLAFVWLSSCLTLYDKTSLPDSTNTSQSYSFACMQSWLHFLHWLTEYQSRFWLPKCLSWLRNVLLRHPSICWSGVLYED